MLAIIDGTVICKIDGLEVIEEVFGDTPFGKSSAAILEEKHELLNVLRV